MIFRLLFLMLFTFLFHPSISNYDRPTDILKKLLTNYKKSEPPRSDKATQVDLGIYINSFYSINEQTMDYSVSMYLRQQWNDPRLSYSHLSNITKPFKMADLSWNLIWLPDTFFRNEKAATFHKVTVNNRMLRLSNDGTLWYVVKITAVLSCPMNLQFYPLDTQVCPLMFESFGYTKDVLTYSWLNNSVEIEKGLQLPQYSIDSNFLSDCAVNYTGGQFPCLQVSFRLRREIGYYLIQVYVPSVLIVILSWVSFWIHVEASPARVSIGLLTVLTTTTMSAGARATLPRVSYIKALDVWMIACLIFVFAGLIEYAIVNVVARGKTAGKLGSGMIRLKNSFKRGIGGLRGSFKSGRKGPEKLGASPRWSEGQKCQKGSAKMGLQVMYRKRRSFTRPRESLIEMEEEEEGFSGVLKKTGAEEEEKISGVVRKIGVIEKDETWVKKREENEESVVIKIGNKIFEGSLRHKTTLQPLLKNLHGDSQHQQQQQEQKQHKQQQEQQQHQQQQEQQQHQQTPQPQLYIRKQGSYNDAFDDPHNNEKQQQTHKHSIEKNFDYDEITTIQHSNVDKHFKQQQSNTLQKSNLILRQQKFQNSSQNQRSQQSKAISKQQQLELFQQQQQQKQHSTTSKNKHVTFIPNNNNNNNDKMLTRQDRATNILNNNILDDSEMNNTYEECCCVCCDATNVSLNRCRRFFRKFKSPCCKLPSDGKKKASKVDKVSRRLFPCLFLFFNLVYWCFYTANHDP